MSSRKQVFAKINTDSNVFFSGFDFSFQAVVVIHQELNSRYISGLLLGINLSDHVFHPEKQVPDKVEESIEVTGVSKLVLSSLYRELEFLPGI